MVAQRSSKWYKSQHVMSLSRESLRTDPLSMMSNVIKNLNNALTDFKNNGSSTVRQTSWG